MNGNVERTSFSRVIVRPYISHRMPLSLYASHQRLLRYEIVFDGIELCVFFRIPLQMSPCFYLLRMNHDRLRLVCFGIENSFVNER